VHKEVRGFAFDLRAWFPDHFKNAKVLEFGARSLNGDVRDLFQECRFVGVDCVPGRNVSIVSLAHEYDGEHDFMTVYSTEMLEHDPYWQQTLINMARHAQVGGLVWGTCATTGRDEHGTRSRPYCCGHFEGPDAEYYRNLTGSDLRSVLGTLIDFGVKTLSGGPETIGFWGLKVAHGTR